MQGRNSLYGWLLIEVSFTHCSFQGINHQQIKPSKRSLNLNERKDSDQHLLGSVRLTNQDGEASDGVEDVWSLNGLFSSLED